MLLLALMKWQRCAMDDGVAVAAEVVLVVVVEWGGRKARHLSSTRR